MEITTVVFDLGGVLVDWNPEHLYADLIPDPDERAEFLGTICTLAWNKGQDAGRSMPEAVAELARQHPAHRELVEAWWDRWPEMLAGEVPDVRPIAEGLHREGIALYALTNWAAETWPFALERFPFMETLFDGIVVSGVEKVAKPDPAIFSLLCTRYGINPATALFIDDSPTNTEAAAALGFRTHTFTCAEDLEAALARLR